MPAIQPQLEQRARPRGRRIRRRAAPGDTNQRPRAPPRPVHAESRPSVQSPSTGDPAGAVPASTPRQHANVRPNTEPSPQAVFLSALAGKTGQKSVPSRKKAPTTSSTAPRGREKLPQHEDGRAAGAEAGVGRGLHPSGQQQQPQAKRNQHPNMHTHSNRAAQTVMPLHPAAQTPAPSRARRNPPPPQPSAAQQPPVATPAPVVPREPAAPAQPPGAACSKLRQPAYFPNREALKEACEDAGFELPHYHDGQHQRLLCPFCDGGQQGELSLCVKVETVPGKGIHALYQCFRNNKCGESGRLPLKQGEAAPAQGDRQVASRPSLNVLDGDVWSSNPVYEVPKWEKLTQELSEAGHAFLAARGISREVIKANDVRTAFKDFHIDGAWHKMECLAFPYKRDGDVVAVKYRTLQGKRFTQEPKCEKIMFGCDDIMSRDEDHPGETRKLMRQQGGISEADYSIEAIGKLVIVEGELDKMACNEVGLWNVVSVPDGAPSTVREEHDLSQDRKFSYFYSCKDMLQEPGFSTEVILATDADSAGGNLASELSRRLKRHRCKITAWPTGWQDHLIYMDMDSVSQRVQAFESGESTDDGSRKDANEVLQKDGRFALRKIIEASKAWPIQGLYDLSSFQDKIWDLYDGRNFEKPAETGWPVLNEFYKVVPGELTVVTGVPNTGKSEFVDALVLSLAQNYYWPICFASFEKLTHQHFGNLAEKVWNKPFTRREGLPKDVSVMTEKEVAGTMRVFEAMFSWIRGEDNVILTIDDVLERAQDAVYRHGIRGLVIDPYNEMEHNRPNGRSETEYISQLLSKIKNFAKTNSVHVWLVAHPRQMQAWKGAAPTLYDISGSAHFNNKADVGIVVHRDMLSKTDDRSEAPKLDEHPLADDPFACHIYVRKVRNRNAGRIGTVVLKYDRVSGRYFDVDSQPGKQICPIRPLWNTDATVAKPQEVVEETPGVMEQFDPSTPIGGEALREQNDQGGMA